MKRLRHILIIDILLLIGVVYLFSSCDSKSSYNHDYEIVHYIDTVNNHVILTTVCDYKSRGISISTLDITN